MANHFQKSNFSTLQANWQNFEPKGKVIVLYGGSTEREISIESGEQVLASLKKTSQNNPAIEVIGFDWSKANPIENLLKLQPDLVFIALHGGDGEDGTIQGFLQSFCIGYSGSGVLGSSLSMDKEISKQIWQKHQLPCPDYLLLSDEQISEFKQKNNRLDEELINQLSLPFVIKPIASGSSLGVSLVRNKNDIIAAYQLAREHSKDHQMVMAEQYIKGSELTVGFLMDQPLEIVAIEVSNNFYDYDAKYLSNQTRLISPAPIADLMRERIIRLATKAYQSIKMSGWGRVDLIVDENQNPYLLEANVVPGMTSHSLVPSSAKARGISFDDLVWQILKTANTPR